MHSPYTSAPPAPPISNTTQSLHKSHLIFCFLKRRKQFSPPPHNRKAGLQEWITSSLGPCSMRVREKHVEDFNGHIRQPSFQTRAHNQVYKLITHKPIAHNSTTNRIITPHIHTCTCGATCWPATTEWRD